MENKVFFDKNVELEAFAIFLDECERRGLVPFAYISVSGDDSGRASLMSSQIVSRDILNNPHRYEEFLNTVKTVANAEVNDVNVFKSKASIFKPKDN